MFWWFDSVWRSSVRWVWSSQRRSTESEMSHSAPFNSALKRWSQRLPPEYEKCPLDILFSPASDFPLFSSLSLIYIFFSLDIKSLCFFTQSITSGKKKNATGKSGGAAAPTTTTRGDPPQLSYCLCIPVCVCVVCVCVDITPAGAFCQIMSLQPEETAQL